MSNQRTRRDFLKTSATVGVGYWISTRASFALETKSPNEKLHVACISVGRMGYNDLIEFGELSTVVALCDVDESAIATAAEKFPDADQFFDYREMIEKLGDKVDVIGVSPPDHSHAAAAVAAMKKGKHVFVQKPLTWSIAESRVLQDASHKYKVVTQMGNQVSADDKLREGVEAVQAGVIGHVHEVHVWTNRPNWSLPSKRPPATKPPEGFHWDLWIGPAPYREYHKSLHPFDWRGWRDFGCGAIGDMWCHTANLPYRALKLGLPISLKGQATDVRPELFAVGGHVSMEFPQRGELPPVTLHWYEGRKSARRRAERFRPPIELLHGEAYEQSGCVLVGEKGMLYSPGDYGDHWMLLPKHKFTDYKSPDRSLPRVKGKTVEIAHKREFLEAVAGSDVKPYSNFDNAAPFTETALLGNIAMRFPNQKLEYDAKTMTFPNFPQANQHIGREYREGWTL